MSEHSIDLPSLQSLQPAPFTTNGNGDIVLPAELREHLIKEIEAGYITPAASEDGELVMLKYAKTAMYDQHWNETTINFRGVLTDADFNKVFARGFTKFFNVSEHETSEGIPPLPEDSHVVLANKMDGSLGLITSIDGKPRIFTSGSARRNEIAAEAEKILHELMVHYDAQDWTPPENITILVEIISEVNPIVVDYGGARRLVALSAVENLTGRSVSDAELRRLWFGEIVEKINNGTPMPYRDSLLIDVPQGEEGFILEFQEPYQDIRAKIKGTEYVEAHRIMTNISIRQLWMAINQGEDTVMLEKARKNAPERAYNVLKAARDALVAQRDTVIADREAEVLEYIAEYNAQHGTSIISANDVAPEDMAIFVKGLQQRVSKLDFAIDMQIAKQNGDAVKKAAMSRIRPRGKTASIITLVSAEQAEVGDDMDDQVAP